VDGNGTVTPAPGTHVYDAGEEVTLTATAGTAAIFSGWTGDLTGSASPATITMDRDRSVTAVFLNTYQLTLTASPPGASGAGFTPESPTTVVHGEWTPVSVTVPAGYRFDNWTVTGGSVEIENAGATSTQVRITLGPASIQTNFVRLWTLTTAVDGNGTVTPAPGTHIYDEGEEVTLSATAGTAAVFSGWTGDLTG